MKINIGPYVHYWTTTNVEYWWYHLRYKKYHWEVKPDELDWLDHFFEKVIDVWQESVNKFVNQFKCKFQSRREKVKVHNYDSWSADYTLALIILPILKQLKETKNGSPYTDDVDVPENLRSTSAPPKEHDYDIDDNHQARWDWILDEMIWAFEQIVDQDSETQFSSGETDFYFQALDANHNKIGQPVPYNQRDKEVEGVAFYEMVNGPKHTYKIDYSAMIKHEARIKNGTTLFGKYYRGLWD